jgi:hypothetical protein
MKHEKHRISRAEFERNLFEADPESVERFGRIEMWRGGLGWAYLLPPLSFGGASLEHFSLLCSAISVPAEEAAAIVWGDGT